MALPPLITLEEHYSSHHVHSTDNLHSMLPSQILDPLHELSTTRLQSLDAGKISIQVISHIAAHMTVTEARASNDELAAVCAAHPSRFKAWAALPMHDVDAAVAELKRAVGELGFVGALVDNHTTDGTMYDGAEYRKVFQTAVELDVPVYIHPAFPGANLDGHYAGNFGMGAETLLATASFGWHAECGLHVLKLFASGLFDELPTLKLGIGHCGELLPFTFDRTVGSSRAWGERERDLRTVFKENVWITTSGMFALPPFECLVKTLGADKVMYSVDYPFSKNETGLEFVEKVQKSGILTEKEFEGFCHTNAERFLKLKAI